MKPDLLKSKWTPDLNQNKMTSVDLSNIVKNKLHFTQMMSEAYDISERILPSVI